MKETETNLDANEPVPLLTTEAYEKLLAQIHKRREKVKRLYQDAIALKEVDPLKAVALLFELHRYYRETFDFDQDLIEGALASQFFFNPKIPESSTIETINFEGTLEECFYRGLQALSGIGKERNTKIAMQYFQFAAEKGYAHSQCLLGHIFQYNTVGVPVNREEAQKWFQCAAEQGDPDAQFHLGTMITFKANDTSFGEALYFTLISHKAYVIPPEAYKLYQSAAAQGHALAAYELAISYRFSSTDADPQSQRQELKWLYFSAKHGYPYAHACLAQHFDQGRGVKKNESEAILWYQLAAEQGIFSAQETLMYRFSGYWEGTGVKINYLYALKWFKAFYPKKLPYLNNTSPSVRVERAQLNKYIEYLRSKLQNFSDRYCLESVINDKEKLRALCRYNPQDFFEEICKDTSLSASDMHEWLIYLLTYHFAEMKVDVQLSLAQKICASDNISLPVALSLIKALQFFPENHQKYTTALEILEKLYQLIDKNGYLARYYTRMYYEKTSTKKLIEETDEENIWSEAAVKYCHAEIVKSSEEFKNWLEKEIRELESLEKTSVAELDLLHEFYYRLAKIKYEEALALKRTQNSFFSKVASWLFWSTPEPIQIAPVIHFLKNISLEHRRFEEAQFLLHECRKYFKESFQQASEDADSTLKFKRGKED